MSIAASSWKRVHFIGIAGAGMSAVAQALAEAGFIVTGCDADPSGASEKLSRHGIKVYTGHDVSHLQDADIVVVSSAIRSDNHELAEAKRRSIPIWHRAKMLSWLMEGKEAIAVAGSHGKSSVTAMLGAILEAAGFDPTVLIGADLVAHGTNALIGKGRWLIAEADESDGSFLMLKPKHAIVTNVELDHANHYPDIGALVDAFTDFLRLVSDDGVIAICADCPNAMTLSHVLTRGVITFGISQDADYRIADLQIIDGAASFWLCHRGSVITQIRLGVLGAFQAHNALAASAMAHAIGVEPEAISHGLASFKGIKRRFELIGKMRNRDVLIIDDYAHHPSEVRAAIQSALAIRHKRCLVIFQPHRYTRTYALHSEFGPAFAGADKVWVTEIYSAWEEPIEGVSGRLICESVKEALPQVDVQFADSFDSLIEQVEAEAEDGDILLVLGAGDIYKVAYRLSGM